MVKTPLRSDRARLQPAYRAETGAKWPKCPRHAENEDVSTRWKGPVSFGGRRIAPMNRRRFLALTAAGAVAGSRALRARSLLRLAAVGQSLILRDLASQYRPGFEQMRERLSYADA